MASSPTTWSSSPTRGWAFDSSAPLLPNCPAYTVKERMIRLSTKSTKITDRPKINHRPRVSWYQVPLWTPLWLNMVLVMDIEIQKLHTTLVHVRQSVPPNHTTPGLVLIALKSPSRTMESPVGGLSSTFSKEFKKVGTLNCYLPHSHSQDPFPNPKAQASNPFVHNPQNVQNEINILVS